MKRVNNRIPDFKGFVMNENKSIDEGFASRAFSRLKGWAKKLYDDVKAGLFKLIPSGYKKGISMVGYFDPMNGDVVNQMEQFFKGTEFANMNTPEMLKDRRSIYEGESTSETEGVIDEAAISLEYTGDDETVRNVDITELQRSIEKLYRNRGRISLAEIEAIKAGRNAEDATRDMNVRKPIFIFGAPGIGKTHTVASAAKKLGVKLIYVDLQFMAPEDFLGIPQVIDDKEPSRNEDGSLNPGTGQTRGNPPSFLPRSNGDDDKGGILFLDEMNRSDKRVSDALMNFIQGRRLPGYTLPSKWIVIAAGNRPEEATVIEFDFAMADRFHILNLVPKVEDWATWARNNNKVPEEIINFVEKFPELFHYLDTELNPKVFPTPRSWTDAAAVIKDEMEDEGYKSWKDIPKDELYNIFYDNIGPLATDRLRAYLDVILILTEEDLEEIVTDPKKGKKLPPASNTAAAIYGISEMLIKKAEELAGNNPPSARSLANILEYFDSYEKIGVEQLSWVMASITKHHPSFAITQEVLDTRETEESKAKIEAAMRIRKNASDKGLLGEN